MPRDFGTWALAAQLSFRAVGQTENKVRVSSSPQNDSACEDIECMRWILGLAAVLQLSGCSSPDASEVIAEFAKANPGCHALSAMPGEGDSDNVYLHIHYTCGSHKGKVVWLYQRRGRRWERALGDDKQISHVLVGKWQLKSIAGKSPKESDIGTWDMTFHPGGQLSYQGSMTGRLTGMNLQGNGSWRVGNGRLIYFAGDNHGSSALDVGVMTMSLSPDPVVAIPGGGDVDTTYIRVK